MNRITGKIAMSRLAVITPPVTNKAAVDTYAATPAAKRFQKLRKTFSNSAPTTPPTALSNDATIEATRGHKLPEMVSHWRCKSSSG